MKLTFLGTRGYIDVTSPQHRRHSSLLAEYRRKRVMIDCGEDWLGRLDKIKPHAIVITHAHPDHAWGLKQGATCPVHATNEGWQGMEEFPIEQRETVEPRKPFRIGEVSLEAFPVIHSIRAPAVGYRIQAGRVAIFYVPDLIDIADRPDALRGIRLYIGDGASPTHPLVHRKGDVLFGHTTIRAQLGWCQEEGVKRALITHCGTQITGGDRAELEREVRDMGRERGVDAAIAHDGMEVLLR